jgi:hypothetical protein
MTETTTTTELRALLNDPRYWKDRDPEVIARVDALLDAPSPAPATPSAAQADALPIGYIPIPQNLNPDTARMVCAFAAALAARLALSENKPRRGSYWQRTDWRDELVMELQRHVIKGDPRDVAAYCAFAWHHQWSVAPDQTAQPDVGPNVAVQDVAEQVERRVNERGGEAAVDDIVALTIEVLWEMQRAQPAQGGSVTEAAPYRIRITPDMTYDHINAAAAAEEARVEALTEAAKRLAWEMRARLSVCYRPSDYTDADALWNALVKPDRDAALSAARASAPAAPEVDDPLDTPLPCEVALPGMKFGKGVKLRTLVDAASRWKVIAAKVPLKDMEPALEEAREGGFLTDMPPAALRSAGEGK